MSRRLKRLESALGVRLFHRAGQRMRLNDDGERLLERASDLVDRLEDLVADARGSTLRPRGRLRISAPLDLAGRTDLWVGLMERHPEVTFEVQLTNRYVDVLREGFDVALRGGRGEDEDLVVRRLGTYALYAVASLDYLERFGRPQRLTDGSCVALKTFSASTAPPPAPHRHLVVDDPQTCRRAALRGLGVAVLPESLVAEDLRQGTLAIAHPDYGPLQVPLYAAFAGRSLMAAALRSFLDWMSERLGE